MKKIAIIDDQPDALSLVESVLNDAISNQELEDEWSVYTSAPLPNMDQYPDLIDQENICIILLDERLGEVPEPSGTPVDYKGSDLVKELRRQYKDMPIYGVTAHPGDSSLEAYFALFDEVIRREDFTQKAEAYLRRFLRAYQAFLEANEKELAELSQISNKIALGQADESEKTRAEAIQKNLELPLISRTLGSKQSWLKEYASLIEEYKKVQEEAEEYLNRHTEERE